MRKRVTCVCFTDTWYLFSLLLNIIWDALLFPLWGTKWVCFGLGQAGAMRIQSSLYWISLRLRLGMNRTIKHSRNWASAPVLSCLVLMCSILRSVLSKGFSSSPTRSLVLSNRMLPERSLIALTAEVTNQGPMAWSPRKVAFEYYICNVQENRFLGKFRMESCTKRILTALFSRVYAVGFRRFVPYNRGDKLKVVESLVCRVVISMEVEILQAPMHSFMK